MWSSVLSAYAQHAHAGGEEIVKEAHKRKFSGKVVIFLLILCSFGFDSIVSLITIQLSLLLQLHFSHDYSNNSIC